MNPLLLTQTHGLNMSERYTPLATGEIVSLLEAKGFQLKSSNAVKVRQASSEGFQRHLMRFSHPDFETALVNARPDLIIINSYDGSSSINLMLGVYRFACANGLIAGTSLGGASIRHVGDVGTKLVTSANQVCESVPKLVSEVQRLQLRSTTVAERVEFSKRAFKLRVESDGAQLLTVPSIIRSEDVQTDAWTVFNVWQEMIMRRGFRYLDPNVPLDKGNVKNARGIKSIGRSTQLNQSLWDLTQEVFS